MRRFSGVSLSCLLELTGTMASGPVREADAVNSANHFFPREYSMDYTHVWSLVILCSLLWGGGSAFDFFFFFFFLIWSPFLYLLYIYEE